MRRPLLLVLAVSLLLSIVPAAQAELVEHGDLFVKFKGGLAPTSLPPTLNRYGYVKHIYLSLHRRFVYRGQRRSYISAACPAPVGFPGAVFPFARASMAFADGRILSSTLTRSCTVRG